nr:GTPase [Phnomibacter ginsenosidimutans]
MNFQSGFVSILGKPNAGKSTLLNALVGEKMAIVSPKVQTTRHRIKAFLNGDNFQIIFLIHQAS